eukprot:2699354-Rhodomonas_salina.2
MRWPALHSTRSSRSPPLSCGINAAFALLRRKQSLLQRTKSSRVASLSNKCGSGTPASTHCQPTPTTTNHKTDGNYNCNMFRRQQTATYSHLDHTSRPLRSSALARVTYLGARDLGQHVLDSRVVCSLPAPLLEELVHLLARTAPKRTCYCPATSPQATGNSRARNNPTVRCMEPSNLAATRAKHSKKRRGKPGRQYGVPGARVRWRQWRRGLGAPFCSRRRARATAAPACFPATTGRSPRCHTCDVQQDSTMWSTRAAAAMQWDMGTGSGSTFARYDRRVR